jgi:hypothetical protein
MTTVTGHFSRFSFLAIHLLILSMLTACGASDRFNIKGSLDNKATMTIRVVYSDGDRLNTVLTAARDGVFEFEGHSKDGSVVDILDNDYRLLARFYAVNGDELTAKIFPNSPNKQQINGNDISERLSAWLNANQKALEAKNSTKEANELIAKYVTAHPNDLVSTILIIDYYDPSADGADVYALLDKLAPEVRRSSLVDTYLPSLAYAMPHDKVPHLDSIRFYVARDSMLTIRADKYRATLIALSDEKTRVNDSIAEHLRQLLKKTDKNTKLLDLSLDRDSILWRRSIRPDSAKWTQGWTPGGIMARDIRNLRINSVPAYIVVDSTGAAIYQGPSLAIATDSLNALRNKSKKK